MATDKAQFLLTSFSQRLQVLGATDSGHILVSMGDFELLDRITLIFVLLVIDDFAGSTRQSHEALLGTSRLDRTETAEVFGPAFLEQHHPYFLSVWLGIERSGSSARETVISLDDFPLAINEELYYIVIGWVFIEEEAFSNELRVDGDDGGNTA